MHPPIRTPDVPGPVRAIPAEELVLAGSRTRRFEGGSFGSAPGTEPRGRRMPYCRAWISNSGGTASRPGHATG